MNTDYYASLNFVVADSYASSAAALSAIKAIYW
jgi:hypothetical protein